MEDFPLIRELDGLFQQDPDIDELGIIFSVAPPTPAAQAEPIPDTGRKADAPPPGPSGSTAAAAAPDDDDSDGAAPAPEPQFILQEHKLGVSVHSVHPLINQARAALPAARREYRWLKQKACAGAGTCRGRDGGCREDGQDAARAAAAAAGREGDLGKTAVGATAAAVAAVEAAAAAVAAERLLSVTRALLLVNADHGSAWNARKEVVVDGLCEGASIPQEMKLLNLIFTKHAKSPNAWAHRRWCWRNNDNDNEDRSRANAKVDTTTDEEQEQQQQQQQQDDSTGGLLRHRRRRQQGSSAWQPLDVGEELRVCERVAELYPKNYYAWTQRSWVVLRVVGGSFRSASAGAGAGADIGAAAERRPGSDGGAKVVAGGVSGENGTWSSPLADAEELLRSEVSFVDKWLTSHVSDHSALNHRKNVISALLAISSGATEKRLETVERERSSNSKLLRDYPGHESLWCYRRFVCQAFLVIAPLSALLGIAAAAAETAPQNAETPSSADADADADAAAALLRNARLEDSLDNLRSREGGGRGAGAGAGGSREHDPTDERDHSLLSGGAVIGESGKPPAAMATATATACGRRYDWARWRRAATEWYEGCVLEDAKAAAVLDSSEEEEEEEEEEKQEEEEDSTAIESGGRFRRGGDDESGGAVKREHADFERADGDLPGAPAGAGKLAEFLGREARFALKCATDKGAWQFDQQRRHALAHLAFVSCAANRILGSSSSSSSSGSNRRHDQPFQQQQQLQTSSVRDDKSSGSGGAKRGRDLACRRREALEGGEGAAAWGGAALPPPASSAGDLPSREDDDDGDGGGGGGSAANKNNSSGAAAAATCLTYCEVTGAPKLAFPLDSGGAAAGETSSAEASPAHGGDGSGSSGAVERGAGAGEGAGGGCAASDAVVVVATALQACRALNAFACGLATADSVEAAGTGSRRGGGVAPYTIQPQD